MTLWITFRHPSHLHKWCLSILTTQSNYSGHPSKGIVYGTNKASVICLHFIQTFISLFVDAGRAEPAWMRWTESKQATHPPKSQDIHLPGYCLAFRGSVGIRIPLIFKERVGWFMTHVISNLKPLSFDMVRLKQWVKNKRTGAEGMIITTGYTFKLESQSSATYRWKKCLPFVWWITAEPQMTNNSQMRTYWTISKYPITVNNVHA